MRYLIFFLALCFFVPCHAEGLPFGVFEKTGEDGTEIFDGDITITTVTKKTGGEYIIIYDQERHAFLCSFLMEKTYVCVPTILTTSSVKKTDRIDEISEGSDISLAVYLKAEAQSDNLKMKFSLLQECTNPSQCDYLSSPDYKLKKESR